MVINGPLNGYGFYGSNSRHSMLDLHNDNNVSIYKGTQEHFYRKYVRICGNLQQFSHCSLYLSYSQHQILDSYFTLVGKF